ncbi:MAG: tRNA pseudouridine(38-40) synthase TruA [Candidatus Eremiobacteraeota bacterium]|nr:tRNA pseudouridine(38-40) synthase TruA [Candidatus Eremiobacteraeota bacterium]
MRESATYRIVVEYDGTDFCGFQFQPQDRTVAGELERALSKLFDRPVKVSAAGRTDAGVHATAQVVSFVAHDAFPIERLALALNSELPADLSARDAARVEASFSARNSALERTYAYYVLNREAPSAPLRRWTHFEHRPLDLEPMRRACEPLVGTHDFVTFCGVLPERGGTVRTLHAIDLERRGELVRMTFRAAGFLHRMVRILTGTLLEVGSGRRHEADLARMLAARDRRAAGLTAPPQGLFLTDVRYEGYRSGREGAPFTGELLTETATLPFDTPTAVR